MNVLKSASDKTTPIVQAACALFDAPGGLGLGLAPLVLGISAASFLGFIVSETGRAILGEIRRRGRLRESRPASPSLRGTPTAKELQADGNLKPRTLLVRLRMGSRLADLAPTLDSGNIYNVSATGAKRIRARGGGMKGYLADNRINVSYSTLMRYKKLADLLRRLLALDARLPLEWLLPGEMPDRELPEDLRPQYSAARQRMARLLRENRNFDRLRKYAESMLGIPELLSIRRNTRRTPRTGRRESADRPLTMKATPERLAATVQAFADFLGEKGLSPKLEKHRHRLEEWLEKEGGKR